MLGVGVVSGVALAASATAAWAAKDFDFVYVQGSTVVTFEVADPPQAIAFALNKSSFAYTEFTTIGSGTFDGQDRAFGDVELFKYSNFNQSGIALEKYGAPFFQPGDLVLSAAGPFDKPLYAGDGNAPQIQTGTYHLSSQSALGGAELAPATLYVTIPKKVTFELKGSVNAVLNFEDYPRLAQYGSQYTGAGDVSYFKTYPVSGTLNGREYNFGDVDFYDQTGGFSTQNGGLDFDVGLPTLFKGPLYAPVFVPGVYRLAGGETLTIKDLEGLPGIVPEPSAWALMLTGFACLGGALRTRRESGQSLLRVAISSPASKPSSAAAPAAA